MTNFEYVQDCVGQFCLHAFQVFTSVPVKKDTFSQNKSDSSPKYYLKEVTTRKPQEAILI